MPIEVRQAESSDVAVVSAMLTEAAQWLERRGMGLWRANFMPFVVLEATWARVALLGMARKLRASA